MGTNLSAPSSPQASCEPEFCTTEYCYRKHMHVLELPTFTGVLRVCIACGLTVSVTQRTPGIACTVPHSDCVAGVQGTRGETATSGSKMQLASCTPQAATKVAAQPDSIGCLTGGLQQSQENSQVRETCTDSPDDCI